MMNKYDFIPFNTDPILDENLTLAEKAVFIKLNSWADANGICSITYKNPWNSSLDDENEDYLISEEEFTQSFKQLEDSGYIKLLGVIKNYIYVAYVCGYEEQLKILKGE